MSNALDIVLHEFGKIAQIPRPSHHEERISAYLCKWAQEHGLTFEKDEMNEVIIDKPASVGCENVPRVIFQAHMDMVCVAEEGLAYDPISDSIKIINDGKTLTADGTSLGADDGIGVAMILYLLQNDSLRHGPIRAIFTTNEEDGMDSVKMDAKYLDGAYLVNLDWETVGSICNSCAGGDFFTFSRKAEWEKPPVGSKRITLSFSNLLGGHSGVGINKGHANALVSLAGVMTMIRQAGFDFSISEFSGGQAPNAIPKFAKAIVAVKAEDIDGIRRVIDDFSAEFKTAFGNIEPEYVFKADIDDAAPSRVLSADSGNALTELMTVVPNNVHTMSPFVDGLVESSSNLGEITVGDDEIRFSVFERSSVAYQATQIGVICRALAERFGFAFASDGHVPGWAVNPNSKLTEIACREYKKLTGTDMIVEPVHAGVECGAFAEKNPNLDMIAIGPTLLDVHTPNESCDIESVRITTELLVKILEAIVG
ncbi:MAG: beta-Ala-His dipeptidase [Clostridia bacterium]|nr:beta-Ala-His dipeptidase [Clostridia bacterium]